MFQTTCAAAVAACTALTEAVLGKNGLGASVRSFRAPAPAELRLGLEHAPVSPWGLNNGVSSTSGSPCLQVRRRKAAVSPLLRPESGTKTRPGPSRSRAPNYYARSSHSEAGSRFSPQKTEVRKAAGKWPVLLFTFHFKMADPEGTLENIIHHSSFIIHHSSLFTSNKRSIWHGLVIPPPKHFSSSSAACRHSGALSACASARRHYRALG